MFKGVHALRQAIIPIPVIPSSPFGDPGLPISPDGNYPYNMLDVNSFLGLKGYPFANNPIVLQGYPYTGGMRIPPNQKLQVMIMTTKLMILEDQTRIRMIR